MKKANNKHLTLSDRIFIESSLNNNLTFTEVAKAIGKSSTTISREVKKHRVRSEGWAYGTEIPCVYVRNCKLKNICKYQCNVLCRRKTNCRCYKKCKRFKDVRCEKTYTAPYVCNGCPSKSGCRKLKYYYRSKVAFDEYKETFSSSRQGINMDKESFDRLDKLISTLVKQGQPISHICSYLKEEIPFSSRTIYRYFEKDILTAGNMDLPRKIKYKPRKKSKKVYKDSPAYKVGRNYEAFCNFMIENMDSQVVEMDTVMGSKSGANGVLLTMLLRQSSIMLIFLMPNATKSSVSKVFTRLLNMLGHDVFKNTFPVFLTDNGSEFKHWKEYLDDENTGFLSEIFFCDSYSAYQKGRIEKNHEYIRFFLPKGKSFDGIDDAFVTSMMNHINSVKRPSLNGHSPYELGLKLLPEELISGLGLKSIPNEQVSLKKKLLK